MEKTYYVELDIQNGLYEDMPTGLHAYHVCNDDGEVDVVIRAPSIDHAARQWHAARGGRVLWAGGSID